MALITKTRGLETTYRAAEEKTSGWVATGLRNYSVDIHFTLVAA
jgi:hypothetical protein